MEVRGSPQKRWKRRRLDGIREFNGFLARQRQHKAQDVGQMRAASSQNFVGSASQRVSNTEEREGGVPVRDRSTMPAAYSYQRRLGSTNLTARSTSGGFGPTNISTMSPTAGATSASSSARRVPPVFDEMYQGPPDVRYAEGRETISRLADTEDYDIVELAEAIDEMNATNPHETQSFIDKYRLGMIRLEPFLTRVRESTTMAQAYARYLELGLVIHVNDMKAKYESEISALREEIATLKSEVAKLHGTAIHAQYVFNPARIVGPIIAPPVDDLPGADLQRLLYGFDFRPRNRDTSVLHTARRAAKYLLEGLVPADKRTAYTIRSKKAKKGDTFLDFPSVYKALIIEAITMCFGVHRSQAGSKTDEAQRFTYAVHKEVTSALQEAFYDYRRNRKRSSKESPTPEEFEPSNKRHSALNAIEDDDILVLEN